MIGAANAILQKDDIKLVVASVSSLVSNLTKIEGENITYYILPLGKGNLRVNLDYVPMWKQLYRETMPDIVHIYGTEYSHGHAFLKACENAKVVISLQGLLTGIYPYYLAGLKKRDILKNLTIKDFLRGSSLHLQQRYKERSSYEKESLQMAKFVIGRTSWDKLLSWSINPNITYFHCDEILQSVYYENKKWDYNKCVKYSIFLSQANYPLKGLHQVLKAMPLILAHFPDTIIRIAGQNIMNANSLTEKLKISGYGLYIRRLVKKLNLEGKVYFTGDLNANEMRNEYLASNIFICPSSIENSPNSLCEAQMLGVPCLASYAGGIATLMKGNEDNLYRYEDVELLAAKVCRVFANRENQLNMQSIAGRRHDINNNCTRLYQIYRTIISSK